MHQFTKKSKKQIVGRKSEIQNFIVAHRKLEETRAQKGYRDIVLSQRQKEALIKYSPRLIGYERFINSEWLFCEHAAADFWKDHEDFPHELYIDGCYVDDFTDLDLKYVMIYND